MAYNYFLRQAQTSDIHPLHEIFCIPKVYRFLVDGSPPAAEIVKNWLESSHQDFNELGVGLWVLACSEVPDIFGAVRLAGLDQQGLIELTYLLHPNIWRRGLATRMAHTAIARAVKNPRIKGVWAGADLPNLESINVMKRLGMTFRRNVSYPLGVGVEYICLKEDFERERNTLLTMEEKV